MKSTNSRVIRDTNPGVPKLCECRVSALIVCLLRTDGAVQGTFPCILSQHNGSPNPQINLAMQTRDRNLGSHGGAASVFLARTQKSATSKFSSGTWPQTVALHRLCSTANWSARLPQRVKMEEAPPDRTAAHGPDLLYLVGQCENPAPFLPGQKRKSESKRRTRPPDPPWD
jgi:hypothetical protein